MHKGHLGRSLRGASQAPPTLGARTPYVWVELSIRIFSGLPGDSDAESRIIFYEYPGCKKGRLSQCRCLLIPTSYAQLVQWYSFLLGPQVTWGWYASCLRKWRRLLVLRKLPLFMELPIHPSSVYREIPPVLAYGGLISRFCLMQQCCNLAFKDTVLLDCPGIR